MMGGGTGAGMMGGGTTPTAAPTGTGASSAPTQAASARIQVTLSDALRIDMSSTTVPHGVPVTFVVTNQGTVLHEFTLGTAEEQAAHEAEMQSRGGMSMPMDEPMAIGVMPGVTKTLTVTFPAAGSIIAGCHVAGHYAAGMHTEISIQ